jgi:hypothetical protein
VGFSKVGYVDPQFEGKGDPVKSSLQAVPSSDLLLFTAQEVFTEIAGGFYMRSCQLSGEVDDGEQGRDRCDEAIPGWPTRLDPHPPGGLIVDSESDWLYVTGYSAGRTISSGGLGRVRTDGSQTEGTCASWRNGGHQDFAFDRNTGKIFVALPGGVYSSQGCPGFQVEALDAHSVALDTAAGILYSIRENYEDGLLWLATSDQNAPGVAEWLIRLRDQEVNCWSETCPDDLGYRDGRLYWRDGNLIKSVDTKGSTLEEVVDHTAPIDALFVGGLALYWVSEGDLFRMTKFGAWPEILWSIGEVHDLYVVETAIFFYGKPELLAPADGSTDLDLTPVLQWTNEGPSHGVWIYDENGTVYFRDDLLSPEFEVPPGYLKPGMTYHWEAYAHGIRGAGPHSEPFSFTTRSNVSPVLKSPTDGGGPFETSLRLTWQAMASAERYNVHVANDPDFRDIVYRENVPAAAANFVAPVAVRAYYWRVQAIGNGVSSPWSEIWSFSVGSSGPLAPQLLTPPDGATNQTKTLNFSWDGAPDASSFHFQLSTSDDFSQVVKDVDGLDDKKYRLSGLSGATVYFWRVAGVDGAGHHTFSQPHSFTTVVDAPTATTLVAPEDKAVHVHRIPGFSWNAQSTATAYQLQIATDEAFSELVVNDSALTETSRTLSSPLEFGSTYFWRVRGRNAGGNGAWSEVRSFTTIVAVPDAVALLEPTDGSKGVSLSPVFSWTSLESALYYQLQIATDSLMGEMIVNDSALTATSDSLEVLLENEKRYYWHVRARNPGGDGPWSTVWSFLTEVATPAAVMLGSPEDGATGVPPYANLSWQSVDDAMSYHLQLAADSGFTVPVLDDSLLPTNSLTLVNPLPYSTAFYWHVRAGRDDGLGKTTGMLYGPWSETRLFTTAVGTAIEDGSGLPTEFALHPAYPNPFNPSTTISFDLPEVARVRIVIFDALGRVVESLVDGRWSAGRYTVLWDAKSAPSGMYFVRMEAGAVSQTKRIVLSK